jgi:GTP-binding protein Era
VLGILHRPDAQVVFVDSPGWHKPQDTLGQYLLNVAREVMEEADVLVVVLDAKRGFTEEDEWVFGQVRELKRRAILAINKVDLVDKRLALPLIERAAQTKLFEAYIPMSAETGDNMPALLDEIVRRLPEGPEWYPAEQTTDQSVEQRIRELIREQLFLALRQEVPHAAAVQLDNIEAREKVTIIQATILVERQGQKAIVIGKRGQALKGIGVGARLEIERLLKRQVFLELYVKVAKDWRDDFSILRDLGHQESQR